MEAATRISGEVHAEYVGKAVKVLVDGENRDEDYPLTARTKNGRLVHLKGDASLIGRFVDVTITKSTSWSLFGEITEN